MCSAFLHTEVSQVWRRRHMSLIGEFKTTIPFRTARLSKAIGEVGSSIGWIRVLPKAWGIIDDMSTRPRRAAAPPKFLSCTSSQADRFQPGTSISGINLPGAGGPTVRQSSFLGGARTRVFGLSVPFVGGWFDLQLDTSGNLWSDPPTPSTRCVCRWRNSPTPEHATAAHAHAHVPHARSVQPVRECPRFRAVKCDSVFIGRAAWHTPTLSMWHPGKSPLSRLPAFRVSGDSTTITSEGWQKTHARRMYPPRAQAFVSHSPRYIGKLFECPCVMR